MKPKLGTSVTALFIATLTLRSTVIVAAVSCHHERTFNRDANSKHSSLQFTFAEASLFGGCLSSFFFSTHKPKRRLQDA